MGKIHLNPSITNSFSKSKIGNLQFSYHYQVLAMEMRRFVVLTKGSPYIIYKDSLLCFFD